MRWGSWPQWNTWPIISMAAGDTPVLFLNHIPIFYNCPKGQVRSAWGGSPFSSGKYSLLLFSILLSLMLAEKPAASGISISPGCVNRFWDRAVVGKLSLVWIEILWRWDGENSCVEWARQSGVKENEWKPDMYYSWKVVDIVENWAWNLEVHIPY